MPEPVPNNLARATSVVIYARPDQGVEGAVSALCEAAKRAQLFAQVERRPAAPGVERIEVHLSPNRFPPMEAELPENVILLAAEAVPSVRDWIGRMPGGTLVVAETELEFPSTRGTVYRMPFDEAARDLGVPVQTSVALGAWLRAARYIPLSTIRGAYANDPTGLRGFNAGVELIEPMAGYPDE